MSRTLASNRPENLQSKALGSMSGESHFGSELGRETKKSPATEGSECVA